MRVSFEIGTNQRVWLIVTGISKTGISNWVQVIDSFTTFLEDINIMKYQQEIVEDDDKAIIG